ncbi:MAG: Asp-tRNA(Asn)/Glu-tRNA(Gln) amidotransferase subunit GatB, partial [bacterium]|nr:Asp-tRNA(Asn)/Glu-tRNA(Gln) amidotransferase subunit GatB [bacterium]
MDYEVVIGMEIHAQLQTESKLFCGCSTKFGGEPNSHCCPICLGFPGSLPVMNRKAVDYVIATALALNCTVARDSIFARKNYYYPDLPKAYQISQYEQPLGENGYLDIMDGSRRIRVRRTHLEEDAGKLVHAEGEPFSLVDYNRGGTSLMEIVTEPDIRSAEEAAAYIAELRSILRYLGVCDGNMEEGSLRCEPNISLRLRGAEAFGVKAELKNINSIRAVQRGVEYEVERQSQILDEGGVVVQETRRWDEASGTTISMRSKEEAHDYRYFPEPDLVRVVVDDAWRDGIEASLPELPQARRERFITAYGLSAYDAGGLTESKEIG